MYIHVWKGSVQYPFTLGTMQRQSSFPFSVSCENSMAAVLGARPLNCFKAESRAWKEVNRKEDNRKKGNTDTGVKYEVIHIAVAKIPVPN